jgi:hypothetical protein
MQYQEKIKAHLSKYKDTVLKITEKGIWKGIGYDHILPIGRKEDNILEPYRKDFFDKKNKKKLCHINYHQYFHHLNSSQAMCINFFYPLYKERKLDLVCSALGIENEQIDYNTVCFEKKSPIDSKGFRPTNFDFYFATKSGSNFYFEIKYTEYEFGKAKYDDEHIIKYQKVYESNLQNIRDKFKDLKLFFENYQIIRNLIHLNKNSYVVFVYPQENKKIHEGAEKAKTEILEESIKSNFRCLSWEKLVECIDKTNTKLPAKLQKNINDFKEKYMP